LKTWKIKKYIELKHQNLPAALGSFLAWIYSVDSSLFSESSSGSLPSVAASSGLSVGSSKD
jgi:hypothetical protein